MGKVLYTGGTFDVFHAGHAKFLERCAKLADTVIVALNSDDFIQEYKGAPPVVPYHQRKAILESSKHVTSVIRHVHGPDSKPTILSVNPDIIAIGTDWASKDYYGQMGFTQDWLDERDITLVYIPYGNLLNSSSIKKKIREGV